MKEHSSDKNNPLARILKYLVTKIYDSLELSIGCWYKVGTHTYTYIYTHKSIFYVVTLPE